jgi:alpha-glucosidase
MKKSFSFLLLILAAIPALTSCHKTHKQEDLVLSSPDSLVQLRVSLPDSLSGVLQYSVKFNGSDIILPSGIEIDLKDAKPIRNNLEILNLKRNEVNEKWERVWGKRRSVTNHYSLLTLELRETVRPRRLINVHFRVYNDAVALRYEIPVQKGLDSLVITNEKIGIRFTGNHTIWAAFWNTFHLSQEKEFVQSTLGDIKTGNIIGTPLLVKAGEKAWISLLEANVTDWACSGLMADTAKINALVFRPSWLPKDSTVVVRTTAQRFSPWKVIMVADRPGRLVESDILQNLNEPCAIDDVSWIKPGVSAWDWWWCGKYAPKAGFKLGSNTETMKYFIDFAAEMGWQYQLVDWQWYGEPFKKDGSFNTDADLTGMNPNINIPELVEYAAKKNIKIVVWLLWANVDSQMEKAFAQYEKWGVAGVKIDFMDRNDQEMVNFYHRVAKTAARHHLVVDFHGAYVPDGFSRTYPNLITREGILGNEYNKWSDRVTPLHCLTIPFTRMLAGEMDFTPGGFLNDNPAGFKVVGGDAPAPHVMGTRCFQLAMMVVYESAFEVFCESPDNVRNQEGSDFLKGLPASWDETKVLQGMPGEYIAVARKSGDAWYIGGMSVLPREISIRPDFLDDKEYRGVSWTDTPDAAKNPRKVNRKEFDAGRSSALNFTIAANGGFTAILVPKVK